MLVKRPSLGGLTAMGVLVLAVGAGAVGGALAAGGQQSPVPTQQVQTIADEEAAVEPSPSPTVTVTATPTPEPGPAEEPVVSDPAPIVEPVPPKPRTETATEAADRAQAEADRAKQEADRAEAEAEKAATTPAAGPAAPAAADDGPGIGPGPDGGMGLTEPREPVLPSLRPPTPGPVPTGVG